MKMIILTALLLLSSSTSWAQDKKNTSAAQLHCDNAKIALDMRFKGGSGEFERLFCQCVEYTPEATYACAGGLVILSFKVDCDGLMNDYGFRNPLGYEFDKQIKEFYSSIQDHWNPCYDIEITEFEVPILFKTQGVNTNAIGLFTIESEEPGFRCKSDNELLAEFERLRQKKPKKALNILEQLIRRNPYDTAYITTKKEIINNDRNHQTSRH